MSKHAITLVEVADRAGVVPEEMHLIHGPFTRDGGYASAQALLSDGPRVTCLFAVNDVMAGRRDGRDQQLVAASARALQRQRRRMRQHGRLQGEQLAGATAAARRSRRTCPCPTAT